MYLFISYGSSKGAIQDFNIFYDADFFDVGTCYTSPLSVRIADLWLHVLEKDRIDSKRLPATDPYQLCNVLVLLTPRLDQNWPINLFRLHN